MRDAESTSPLWLPVSFILFPLYRTHGPTSTVQGRVKVRFLIGRASDFARPRM
jgi:hypothetical protein